MLTPAGDPALSVSVSYRVSSPVVVGSTLITPFEDEVMVDASGNFLLTVQQSLSVIFTVVYPILGTEPMRQYTYTGNIPATETASFTDVIVVE